MCLRISRKSLMQLNDSASRASFLGLVQGSEPMMPRHAEARAALAATPQLVFDRLDDPTLLGAHMSGSSLMMGGGRMTYQFDAGGGRAVGSHIHMGGRAFGLELSLDEVIAERDPPRRKLWRTVGEPRLLVIGAYEMGFEITPADGGAMLRVWIDFEPPARGIGRLVPALAAAYARWCVEQMVGDAAQYFGVLSQVQRAALPSAA
jgi:hypothetical protein